MADGTFRHLVHDEERRREKYLDHQLEIGWEVSPADQALEPGESLMADRLLEQREESAGSPALPGPAGRRAYRPASRRPQGLRRSPVRASAAARQTRSAL